MTQWQSLKKRLLKNRQNISEKKIQRKKTPAVDSMEVFQTVNECTFR